MPHTLFLSWQSDTPARIGSEFIEEALGLAVATLGEDAEIKRAIRDEGLMVDRDTQGVPGVPPIVDTIFDKIDSATIFVPDLTFVGKRIDRRPTPDPNVLVEYGWALKSLPYTRIIPVMNVAFGEPTPETMPFDMRHLRHPKCTYSLPTRASERRRREELARLAASLTAEIGAVLRSERLRTTDQRMPFPAAEPKDGQARFRARGEPLGRQPRGFPIALADGPTMWLGVMPQFAPAEQWGVTELARRGSSSQHPLLPLGIEAFGNAEFEHVLAEDGFGIYAYPPQPPSRVSFVFRTGEVWGIDAYHLRDPKVIPFIEPHFVKAFKRYAGFLSAELHVAAPYEWIAGVEGVEEWAIEIPRCVPNQLIIQAVRGRCLSDTVVKKGTHGEGADPRKSLRPFFVELYDRCTIQRPDWMDDFAWPQSRY